MIKYRREPKATGIVDTSGTEIHDGDWVALDAMTADDSMGLLPNGWIFNPDEDIYQVYFDDRINTWSLHLGCEPDTPENCKYMSHAVSCLHDGLCEVVEEPEKPKESQ